MKLFVVLFLFIISLALFAENTKPVRFEVTGISGSVLTNVDKLLHELQQNKILNQIDPDELRPIILKAIQAYGFFHPEIKIQKNENRFSIHINLRKPLLIDSLKVQWLGAGALDPSLLQLKQNNPLHLGDVLSMEIYNQVKLQWVNAAESLGYLHAQFKQAEILIDEEQNTAEISLIFDTGPLYRFGPVQFDQTNIHPNLLHQFVPFRPGDTYSSNQILLLDKILSSSGYFNSVLIKPQINDSQTVPIQVHLEPVPKYSYTLGGGFGTDTGLRGRAGLHVVPVNPKGHQFHATAQGSFTQNVLQAQYLVPGNNPMTEQYAVTGNFSNLHYDAGYSNAWLISLAKQSHVDEHQRALSLNALYEGFHYSTIPNNYQFLLYPKAMWTRSDNPNTLFSPSGKKLTISGLAASKLALSTINMGQLFLDAKAAYTIDPLRLRLYGHVQQGFNFTEDVSKIPLSLALLLGGTENLKAYDYNSLGPAKAISYAGFEIQKEIKNKWYALGFFDAGYANSPLVKNPKLDLGLGLMWISPIGPIKLGLAQAINDRFQRQDGKPRLVISMGSDL